jgi:hypothetical protein
MKYVLLKTYEYLNQLLLLLIWWTGYIFSGTSYLYVYKLVQRAFYENARKKPLHSV